MNTDTTTNLAEVRERLAVERERTADLKVKMGELQQEAIDARQAGDVEAMQRNRHEMEQTGHALAISSAAASTLARRANDLSREASKVDVHDASESWREAAKALHEALIEAADSIGDLAAEVETARDRARGMLSSGGAVLHPDYPGQLEAIDALERYGERPGGMKLRYRNGGTCPVRLLPERGAERRAAALRRWGLRSRRGRSPSDGRPNSTLPRVPIAAEQRPNTPCRTGCFDTIEIEPVPPY